MITPCLANKGLVVMGASWGGVDALDKVLGSLSKHFAWPVLVVLHQHASSGSSLTRILQQRLPLPVYEAADKHVIPERGIVLAAANYHLLVEPDKTLSLSSGERVKFSRPSIDVMFSSAADYFGSQLIGVLLTGANDDGASGLRRIQQRGGCTLVQDPVTAEAPVMPQAALSLMTPDYTLNLKGISAKLMEWSEQGQWPQGRV